MNITLEVSFYPLDADYVPAIKRFILELRQHAKIEIVTNQMSTQVRGDFDAVWSGVTRAMKQGMSADQKCVFVIKCLNADLPIGQLPVIE
jgi:uncharacterized protein YqgV (UPF0045/DUF77 family)